MLTLLAIFGSGVSRHLKKHNIYEPKCDGTLYINEYDSFGTEIPKSEFPSFDTLKLPPLPITIKDVTLADSYGVEKFVPSMIMATLHDTRVAGFMPLTRIGSTGCIGMKASGEKPKKLANGKLTKQASSVSDTVLLASKAPNKYDRDPKTVHFLGGCNPGDSACQYNDKGHKANKSCNCQCKSINAKRINQLTMDNRIPKLIPFIGSNYTDQVTSKTNNARKQTKNNIKQKIRKPTKDLVTQEAKVQTKDVEKREVVMEQIGDVEKEKAMVQTKDVVKQKAMEQIKDVEKQETQEQTKDVVKHEAKGQTKDVCKPETKEPPRMKPLYSERLYACYDPYRTDIFAAHECAEYSAWEHYDMDYMGGYTCKNIEKTDQTLAQNGDCPYTYFPYNHPEEWKPVQNEENMALNQGATGKVELTKDVMKPEAREQHRMKALYSEKLHSSYDPYRTDMFAAHDCAEYSAWERYEIGYTCIGKQSDNILPAQNAHYAHSYPPYNHPEEWGQSEP